MIFIEKVSYFKNSGVQNPLLFSKSKKKSLLAGNFIKDRKYRKVWKIKNLCESKIAEVLVPSAGIEPAHLAVLEFESSASTNSANWARNWVCKYRIIFYFRKINVHFLLKNPAQDHHTLNECPPEAPFPFFYRHPCGGKCGLRTFFSASAPYIRRSHQVK